MMDKGGGGWGEGGGGRGKNVTYVGRWGCLDEVSKIDGIMGREATYTCRQAAIM